MPVSRRRKPKHQGPTPASKILIAEFTISHRCGCDGDSIEVLYSDGTTETQVTHQPDPCGWRQVNPHEHKRQA